MAFRYPFLAAWVLGCSIPGQAQSQLSATPNPVALSAGAEFVQVMVGGSGPFSITNQAGSFFSVSPASLTAPTTLTVGLASTICSNGGTTSCSGSFTLHLTSTTGGGTDMVVQVTFTLDSGGGAGGVISASPNSVTFNVFANQTVSTSVTLTTASTTQISFSFSTVPAKSASWLSVSVNGSQVSANSPVTMSVFANATNITTQQTGSITIVPGNGGSQTVIPVTLNVSVTSGGSSYGAIPTNVALAYPGGPASQQVVIFGSNSAVTTFNASVTNCNSTSFLLLNGGTQIVNQPVAGGLTFTLNGPAAIPTGSYSCQAVVSNPSNSADEVTITVTLTVNGGGSLGGGFALNPSTLSLTSVTGSTNSQATSVSLVSSVQTTFNATFTSQSSPNGSANWITINGTGSQALNQQVTGVLTIALNNPQSFTVGNYSGTVTISNPNTSSTVALSIFLTVTGTGSAGTSYTLNTNSATFQYPFGQQTADIDVSSNTQTQFIATTSVSGGVANWLLLTQGNNSGTSITGVTGNGTTNPITVYLNESTVPQVAGTYTGLLKIANPSNSGDFALVTITLVQSYSQGGFSANPTSLTFSTSVGVVPAPQFVAVTVPSSSSTFTASVQAASGSVFVVSPCNGCNYAGSQNQAVSVNPLNLGPGIYTNYITLASGGNAFAVITVTLTVGNGGGTTGSIAAPASLSFFWQAGQSLPPPQTIAIAPGGTFTATSTQTWILATPTSGTGPANVTVIAIPQGFAAGSVNQGVINITTPSGSQSVNVILTISSGPVLYANPGTIYVRYIVGLLIPTQLINLQFTASDGSSPTVTANAQAPWIYLGNSISGAPNSYSVSVNASGLCNGLNTGSIAATAAGMANSPLTVPVVVLVSNSRVDCGGPAIQFVVSAPASVAPGVPFRISVTATDANNNIASSYAGTIHFTSTDAAAALPNDSALNMGAGTFSVTLNTTGPQIITVADTAIPSITGASIPIFASFGGSLAAEGVSPAFGSGASPTFTVTLSDPLGSQDLDVVNVLINNFLDGRGACYLAYSHPLNTLYLVNDAGTALLPGLALNGSGSVSNSQCTVNGAGSSASGSGGILTLNLNLSFSPSFGGNKVVYLAARDLAQHNTGWQPLGTWSVPGAPVTSPAVGGVSPARGSSSRGSVQTFSFTFTDTKGWQDLGVLNILINSALDGRNACYLAYNRASNVLYVVNDAGGALLPGLVLNGFGETGNSQCTVYADDSSADVNGNTLTLTLSLNFRLTFPGNQIVYMAARDATGVNNSGWQAMGTWSVQ